MEDRTVYHVVRYLGRGRYAIEAIKASFAAAVKARDSILAVEPAASVSIIRFAKGNF